MAQKTTKPVTSVKTEPKGAAPSVHLMFDKSNYRLLIIAMVVVAFGFFLMAGTTDIYSTTKIVIAPIIILAGFGIGFVSILKKPATKA